MEQMHQYEAAYTSAVDAAKRVAKAAAEAWSAKEKDLLRVQ